jgi:Flp pilus assembly protein TadD
MAEICRNVLRKKEDENNMYAAMTIATIFGERGRFKEASDILNGCQEAHPNNPRVLYNLALIEYLQVSFSLLGTTLLT